MGRGGPPLLSCRLALLPTPAPTYRMLGVVITPLALCTIFLSRPRELDLISKFYIMLHRLADNIELSEMSSNDFYEEKNCAQLNYIFLPESVFKNTFYGSVRS